MRFPSRRLNRCRLFEHTVNLLKCETFCLRNEEVSVEQARGAKRTPKVEDLRTKVVPLLAN